MNGGGVRRARHWKLPRRIEGTGWGLRVGNTGPGGVERYGEPWVNTVDVRRAGEGRGLEGGPGLEETRVEY